MPDRRRYPILVALLHETTIDLVDEIVDLFNRALKKTDSRSRTGARGLASLDRSGHQREGPLVLTSGMSRSRPGHPGRAAASTHLRGGRFPRTLRGRGRGNRAASPSARRLLSRLRREPLWPSQEIRSTGPEGAGLQEPEDRRPPNRCSRDSERAESQATTAGSRGRGTRVRLRQVARPIVGIRRASQPPVLRALCSLPTP